MMRAGGENSAATEPQKEAVLRGIRLHTAISSPFAPYRAIISRAEGMMVALGSRFGCQAGLPKAPS